MQGLRLMSIALRNLGRARARTALSLASVAAGVLVVVLAKGTIDGSLGMVVDNSIAFSLGHIRIIDGEYLLKQRLLSLNYPVDGFAGEGYESMAQALAGIDRVENVVPRLRFGAMISRGADTEGVLAMGVDPGPEEKLVRYSRYLDEGRFVETGERGAVIGRRTLDKLGLDVGDRFTLVFTTSLGALKGYTLTVVGSLASGLPYLDEGLVFVPLDVAQAMLDMGPAVTELLVMARDEASVPRVLREVEQLLAARDPSGRYVAKPWYEQSELVSSLQMVGTAYNVVYFFVLALASFVVVNTMLMIVNERRREIGMMGALGLRPGEIRRLFLYEGGFMGLGGSALGSVLGAVALGALSRVGIALPDAGVGKEFFIPMRLYPEFSLRVLGFAFLAGIAVTLIATALPARNAAAMEPTEALRV